MGLMAIAHPNAALRNALVKGVELGSLKISQYNTRGSFLKRVDDVSDVGLKAVNRGALDQLRTSLPTAVVTTLDRNTRVRNSGIGVVPATCQNDRESTHMARQSVKGS